LSTNYTLVNLGSATANVSVTYYTEGGTNWAASAGSTNFTVAGNGGQTIIAQYFDATMSSGRGSAVVASDQPMGAVVQILARNQTPTSGAYIGSSNTDTSFYVPLIQRNTVGTNSQIMIQNAGASTATVTISLVKAAASPGANHTVSGLSIPAGATYYYDVTDESLANLASGWYGSAAVTSTGPISVISNKFSGADSLQTFNAFMSTQLGSSWYIPLFTSRLANGLSTPISVQNLSGSTISSGGISMECTKDPASSGSATFTVTSNAAVANTESYFFNPVTDLVNLPTDWYGSCRVTAPGNVAVFVQMRKPGLSADEAAYEAIRSTGTNTTVLVPLVGKILANGFATPVTIQNLGGTSTTVDITYTPSQNYVSGGGSAAVLTETGVTIAANGSLIRNFRAGTTVPGMPNGWYGTMRVESSGNAIDGFVQLTTLGATTGDTLLAHGVFTLP